MPILKNKKKQVVADGVFYAELDEVGPLSHFSFPIVLNS